MILNFEKIEEQIIPNFKGGEKQFRTRMYTDEACKIMRASLEPGRPSAYIPMRRTARSYSCSKERALYSATMPKKSCPREAAITVRKDTTIACAMRAMR